MSDTKYEGDANGRSAEDVEHGVNPGSMKELVWHESARCPESTLSDDAIRHSTPSPHDRSTSRAADNHPMHRELRSTPRDWEDTSPPTPRGALGN